MHSHSKQSSQAPLSLHAMRGKSWLSFQKHIPNFIGKQAHQANTHTHNIYKWDPR